MAIMAMIAPAHPVVVLRLAPASAVCRATVMGNATGVFAAVAVPVRADTACLVARFVAAVRVVAFTSAQGAAISMFAGVLGLRDGRREQGRDSDNGADPFGDGHDGSPWC